MPISNLEYMKEQKIARDLTHVKIAELTEYSLDSVLSWFASSSSERFRDIPIRATSLMKAKLEVKDLRAECRRLQAELDRYINSEEITPQLPDTTE